MSNCDKISSIRAVQACKFIVFSRLLLHSDSFALGFYKGSQKGYFVRDAKESFDSAFGKNGFYFDFIERIGTEERTGKHDRDSTLSTGQEGAYKAYGKMEVKNTVKIWFRI